MAKQKKNSNYVTEKRALAEEQRRKEKSRAKTKKIIKAVAITAAALILIAAIILGICYLAGAFDYTPEPTYHATIVLADGRSLHVELYGNDAPKTVEAFISRASSGYYDGLTLHTAIDDLVYGGALNAGVVTGGITGEFSANGHNNRVSHERGVISMARGEEYDSGFGQFFIVTKDSPELDGNYAAFGRITSGIEIIDEMLASAEISAEGTITVTDRLIIADITTHAAHD